MKTNLNYTQIEENLMDKGFTREEVDKLTDWWRADWDWLFAASAEEIRAASVDCLS